jgi:hypothetical protein
MSTKTICVDLDGTLCTNTFGEYESAEPFPWAIERVNGLARAGHRIVIFTARGTATGIDWDAVTRGQLERWGVAFDELRFGKPSADVYIDDRAVHTTAWRCADISEVPGFGLGDEELPAVLPGHLASVAEVGRTYAGSALRLERHAQRALTLADRAGIRPLPAAAELVSAVEEALERAGAGADEQVFTISISASGHAGYADVVDGRPAHHVACRPLDHAARGLEGRIAAGTGAGLALAASSSGEPGWPLAEEAEGTLHDQLGCRIATVAEGRLVVEAAGEPAPVAAEWLLELARAEGLEAGEGAIRRADLEASDEALVVGSPFCLLPLATLDGEAVWQAAPGPVTERLLSAFSESCGVDLAVQTGDLVGAG